MNCPNCTTPLQEGALFCVGCGMKLDQIPRMQPTTEVSAIVEPTFEEETYEIPAYEQPEDDDLTIEQPRYQNRQYQEPRYEQPAYGQPVYEQPAYEQAWYQEPQYEQPAYQNAPYQGYAQGGGQNPYQMGENAIQGRKAKGNDPDHPKKPSGKSKKGLWIILIALVSALIVGVAAYMIISGKDSGEEKKETKAAEAAEEASGSAAVNDMAPGGIIIEPQGTGSKEEAASETDDEAETAQSEAAAPETTAAETAAPETAAPETTAPETTAGNEAVSWMLDESEPAALSAMQKVPTTGAYASSAIDQAGYDNSARVICDGDIVTSWQEGVKGSGIGETVTIEYPRNSTISCIVFRLGNWRDDDYYYGNNKPSDLKITASDGTSWDVSFSDNRTLFYLTFDSPIRTDSLTFEITGVYKGTDWDDTCIAEITAYK